MTTIYFLKNPTTQEIFYVGATTKSLEQRLKKHYTDLNAVERWERLDTGKSVYLRNILPVKATIHPIVIVEDWEADIAEQLCIELHKSWGFSLVNQTIGGKGGYTVGNMTDVQKKLYGNRISKALTGITRSKEFIQNMSDTRKGLNNPAAKEYPNGGIVAFKDGVVVYLFLHHFEIANWSGSYSTGSNVKKLLYGQKNSRPRQHDWKWFNDCTKPQQKEAIKKRYL